MNKVIPSTNVIDFNSITAHPDKFIVLGYSNGTCVGSLIYNSIEEKWIFYFSCTTIYNWVSASTISELYNVIIDSDPDFEFFYEEVIKEEE